MKHSIDTDMIPVNTGKYSEDNWPQKEAWKFIKAREVLGSMERDGHFHCYYDSHTKLFSANKEKCQLLSENEIITITEKINSIKNDHNQTT